MKNSFLTHNHNLALYTRIRLRLASAKARYYDKKIGIITEKDFCPKEDNSFYKDGVGYSPTFYGRLQRMVAYLKLGQDDVFVDIGCGKGRVVFFVALQKIKKVMGVEINKDLIDIAKDNLKKLKLNSSPVEFIHLDAIDFKVKEGTVFFMFHPFGLKTLEQVIGNLKEYSVIDSRKIRIVYYAPEYYDLLDRQDWLIREGEIEDKNCLVWQSR